MRLLPLRWFPPAPVGRPPRSVGLPRRAGTGVARLVSPTDAGRYLVEGARQLLAESAALEFGVRDGVDRLSGLIRLSAPSDLDQTRVIPVIDRLIAQHPDIQVDLQLSDGRVDLIARVLIWQSEPGIWRTAR